MMAPEHALLHAADRLLPVVGRLPQAFQCQALQRILGRLLAAPLADGSFDVLQGRWVRLQVRDLNIRWDLSCSERRIRVASDMPVTTTISGHWRHFLLLASRHEDPDTLFFRRRLTIEGDTEFGLVVKNMLDGLDQANLPTWLWQALQRVGAAAAEQQAAMHVATPALDANRPGQ